MAMLTQGEINDAFTALIQGDPAPWDRVLRAIRRKEVTVAMGGGQLAIKAVAPNLDLGQMLAQLRRDAGNPPMADVAEAVGISLAGVQRALTGKVLPGWPTVQAIVLHLGGDPEAVRGLYRQARERRLMRAERP